MPDIYCTHCYQAMRVTKIKLVQTGWEHPYSWECPICKKVYGDDGKTPEEFVADKEAEKEVGKSDIDKVADSWLKQKGLI